MSKDSKLLGLGFIDDVLIAILSLLFVGAVLAALALPIGLAVWVWARALAALSGG